MEQQQSNVCRTLYVIAYIRNFFSEKAFASSIENGIRMKTVVWSRETEKYVEWIRSIESQVDNIHRVVLGIHDDKNEMVEMYSIDIQSIGDIKEMCIKLQRMNNLPRNVTIRLKVYSYIAIEMKGFKAGNKAWSSGNIENIEAVNGLSIYSTRKVNLNGEKRIFGEANEIKDISRDISRIEGCEVPSKYEVGNIDGGECGNNENQNKGNNISNGGEVRCICGISLSDGDMMQCDMCNNWLHTVCSGYFSNQDKRIPKVYECLFCTGNVNKKHKNAGIYRRILAIIYNEGCCMKTYIQKRLGISLNYIDSLYKRLSQDGLVKLVGVRYVVVTDKQAKVKVKEYFSAKVLECSMSIEEIELE